MKVKGVEVDTSKGTDARINWEKILGKASNGARALFEPVMPSTVNTLSSATGVMRDTRNALRATRTATQRTQSNAKNSSDNRKAMSLFKSAFDAIESGTFTMEKINDDLYDDYESDTAGSFKMPTGDEVAEMSSEEILLVGNKGVAQSIIQSSSAQLRGLQESSKALINANIKSTQALGLSINNTLHYGFSSINTNLTIQNQKLDSINRNISSILAFNNANTLEFYSKSIDMMAGIGKMMTNLEKSMNPDPRKKERVFDTSNGLNIREYVKYVKEGIQESFFGAGASAIKGAGGNSKDFGIMGIISDLIIPKAIKDPLQKFDKSLTRFFKEGFKRLGEELNKNDLFQAFGLGDIFGSKRAKINGIDLGKYMKDATPWNGIAQKALVEVIPELLTSIDSKLDNSEKRYYDYNKGHFIAKSKIEEEFKNEYFDTISTMLRESMDKLTEITQSSGRQDGDRLIASIQAIIDDHLSGSKDEMTSRREMESEMKKFGIGKTDIKDFIMEFTDGLEGAISRINDLYHEIGSTQHIYRNINNSKGHEYTRNIQNIHSQRKTNYRSFSFFNKYSMGDDPASIIAELQRKANITDVDLSNDINLQNTIVSMMSSNSKESALIAEIRRVAALKRVSDKGKEKFKFVQKIKDRAGTFGSSISEKSEAILNPAFEVIYLDSRKGKSKESTTNKKRGASSFFSKKGRRVSSREEREFRQINDLNQGGYSDFIDKSEAENDRDHNTIARALDNIAKTEPETSVEGSITQSTNALKSFLSALMVNFKGFTSRLFGKEGFFRKIWDSEFRKKATDKIKTKLFTGEDAIFKKPYEKIKSGLKHLKDDTKRQFGKGYDYLYDNTMQYMYGEKDENGEDISYRDSDRWKSNKFVSQSLNREWRAEQRKLRENEKAQAQVDELRKEDTSTDARESTQRIKSIFAGVVDNVSEAAHNLEDSVNTLVDTTVGDHSKSPDEKKRAYTSEFAKKLKSTMPKALVGITAGAGVGLLNSSFSLLGSMFLPGGPIAGAIVGGGLSILSQTEAFKKFMYGDVDKDGNRQGGLISQELQSKFKKMMPYAVGGAVLGGLKGLLKGAVGFNSGLGVLGMQILPGGILGGALLGAGLGVLKNSEGFKKMLFGEKGEDGKRSGKFLSDSFNKLRGKFSKAVPGLKKAGAGLGIGAISGAVLSNAGYLPAMLSLGGPVGMGIAGLGIGIAASTKRFNEWLFGSEELDENGNPTGNRRKDGMLTRVTNILRTNVVEPISDAFKSKMLDLVDWTKDKVTYPFRLAFGPILDSLVGIKDNVVDFVKDKFEVLGNGIMDMMRKTMKSLFSPVTKLIGFVGKSIMGIASSGAKLAMAPLSMGLQAVQFLTAGKRRKEYADFYKNYYSKGNISGALREKWAADAESGNKRNIFGKFSDTIGAYIGHGEIADAARSGWNEQMGEEGKDHLKWRSVNQERREMREARDKRRADEKQWRNIDKYRSKIINDDLNGREVTLTDYQFDKYRKKFSKLGISEDYLQSSDDIMDLLYRKNEFKKKMNPNETSGKGNGLIVEETPEQKEAREKTEKYQEHVKSILDKVADRMGIAAKDLNEKKAIKSATEEWRDDKKKLARRLKKAKIGNVKLDNPELQDFDISEVDSDRLDDYRFSDYYSTGDFIGFLKSRKITQKSAPILGSSEVKAEVETHNGFSRVIELLQGIKDVNDEQKELASAQVEIATAGEIDDTAIKKKRGKSLGSRIARKFNGLATLLNLNKKKSRQSAEDAESISAREGTDKLVGDIDNDVKEETVKEKSTLGKLWDKIKSGAIFGGSKIGGFISKGIKTVGIIGLLGGLGLTVAELIRPGISDKIGAKIDAFTDYVTDDEFSMKKVFTDFSEWFNNSFIDGWWGKTVKPWWDEEVVPVWETTILPGIKKIPEIIITGLPGLITNVGGLIATHSDTIVDAFTAVIKEIGVPLVTAVAKGTPAILGAVLEGSWEVLKALGNEMLYLLGIKDRPKEDISNTTKSNYEQSGTQVATEKVGSVSAGTIDEAIEKAKSEYGLSNPNVVYNPNTGKFDVYSNIVTDKHTARDAKTGARVKVGGIRSDQLTESTTRLAAYGLGDAAFNLFGGRGKAGVKVAQTGVQAAATASGKVLQGTGWVGRKVLGKIPIVGVPFKVVGGAVQAGGKAVESAAHPIQTAKTIKAKASDNKLFNGLFGTKEFRAGKAAASAAADVVENNAARYAQNAAGRWYDTTTGKFVKAEVAEAAMKSADNIVDAASNVKLRDRGLVHNLLHPIDTIKTGAKNTLNSIKNFGDKLLHPGKSIKDAGSNLLNAAKDKVGNAINSVKNLFARKTSDVAEEGSEALMKNVAKSSTEKVAESAIKETQKSTLETLLKKLSKWLGEVAENKAVEKAARKLGTDATDSILKKLSKFLLNTLDTILENSSKCLKKLTDLATAAVAKITGKLGVAAGTLGIAEIVSIGVGGVFGAIDAANLFQTKDPDWIMRVVSGIIEALLSSSIGAGVDFLFEAIRLIGDISGKDWNFKKDIAEFLYKLLCGYSNESIERLEVGQAALAAEKDIYNALNNTNLSLSSYNEEANKSVFGKVLDGGKSIINWGAKLFGKKDGVFKTTDTATAEDVRKALNAAGYSDAQISEWAKNDTKKLDQAIKSVGYGQSTKAATINGMYAQGDSRWAKMPIGMLPDGSVATMDRAGCGPTALAAVANTVASRSVGYGQLTPADIGAYAASNGYISQGGANAGLFTEGAAKLGLNSSPIANSAELRSNLLAGKPAILTGKSSNSSDPYTSAGHIVMADGLYGNKMSVLDPITGKRKLYDIDSISKNTEHAWSYSAGYGPYYDSLSSDDKEKAKQIAFGKLDITNAPYSVAYKEKLNGAAKEILTDPTIAFSATPSLNSGTPRIDNITPSITRTTVSSGTTNLGNMQPDAGIIDYGKIVGYHTEDSGADTTILDNNYNYFIIHDKYFHNNYKDPILKHKNTPIVRNGRNGKRLSGSCRLAYILSTQYFGLNGGVYGSITIAPKTNYYPTSLTKDEIAKIFAAAIISENVNKHNKFVTAPLSEAEKLIAFCNGCRVICGLANTLTFMTNSDAYHRKINSVSDSDYMGLVNLESSIGNDITTELNNALSETNTSSTGIRNAEELAKVAKEKGFLGKIGLLGKIAQAKMNSILNGGTDFWLEFEKLTAEESGSGSSSSILTGASTTLTNAIKNPNNIQEELLGKTLENIYRGESGGNYAAVINDTNDKASVGPYQANGKNAVELLKDLQNAQGISSELRKKYSDYANIIAQGKPLTDDQKNELSAALSNSEYAEEIKKAIDKNAMKYQNSYYSRWYAGYYDDDIIKDLRTLPMLADIANTGPGFIVNKGDGNEKSFMYHWKPVSKSNDFEEAYKLLNDPKTYWKSSKYASGYMKRINATYDNMKNYVFKKSVPPGELHKYFAKNTNPLGFGDADNTTNNGNDKTEKLKNFTSSISAIGDAMSNYLSEKTGIEIGNLGLTSSVESNDADNYTYNGNYSMKNSDLINLKGTDRDRFLAAARSQIGYMEKSNGKDLRTFSNQYNNKNDKNRGYTKYGSIMGSNPNHWCAYFTSWAAKTAGIPNSIIYRNGGCSNILRDAISDGTIRYRGEYTANPGDLVLFNSDWEPISNPRKATGSGHIGIVTSVNGDIVNTIEGNTGTGTGTRGVAAKQRKLSSNTIIGFVKPPWQNTYESINPNEAALGYGKPKTTTKIDSPAQREQLRKAIDNQEEFKVTPKDFEAIGFGPGMSVDAGFDMSSTDGKLDQIVGIIAEWFAESKKGKAADSAATTNVNLIKANTTNVTPATTPRDNTLDAHKYRNNIVNHHVVLSSKANVRNTL